MAKAKLLYAHVCDQAFPSEGGKLNLVGVFAGLNNPGNVGVAQFPGVYPRLALAVGLSTTLKELPLEVTFRDEEGKDIVPPFTGTFTIEKQGATESANVNFNLNFDTFQLSKPGKVFLTIEVSGEEVGEIELTITQATPPAQQNQPPAAK